MRVLAFEDGWDIAELLEREGVAIVDLELVQHWDTLDFLDKIIKNKGKSNRLSIIQPISKRN